MHSLAESADPTVPLWSNARQKASLVEQCVQPVSCLSTRLLVFPTLFILRYLLFLVLQAPPSSTPPFLVLLYYKKSHNTMPVPFHRSIDAKGALALSFSVFLVPVLFGKFVQYD